METGYDIIFFWVARMVFFGIEEMGDVPFRTVYLHGLVRDAEGQKMSKTKGNVVEPTDLVDQYGADAVRFALIFGTTPGQDQNLSQAKLEDSRNFANKLWNATRFGLPTIRDAGVALDGDGPVRPPAPTTEGTAPGYDLALADRWILSRLDAVTADVTRLLESFNLGEAGRQLRSFIWNELCDWYIEAAKVRLRGSEPERRAVAQTLAYALERSLRLLHPFMPFVTEALWQELPHAGDSVVIAPWPRPGERDQTAEADFDALIEIVRAIRTARQEANVEPARWIAAHVHAGARAVAFEGARRELGALARIADDQLAISAEEPGESAKSVTAVAGDVVALLPLAGLVDLQAERERLGKELAATEADRDRAQAQLSNEAFTSRAPEHVVEAQRKRLAQAIEQVELLRRRLADLGA
jgi:valyl-tRNA synthetase